MKILFRILALACWFICFGAFAVLTDGFNIALAIIFIIFLIFGIFLWRKGSNKKKQSLKDSALFKGFPEIDKNGMKALRVLDNVKLSGVTREHDGINPQKTIERLHIGDEVFFKRVPMKKYPNATLVIDKFDNPVGWIPEDFHYQEDIAERLDKLATVQAVVSDILGGDNGLSYGVRLNIARYEINKSIIAEI